MRYWHFRPCTDLTHICIIGNWEHFAKGKFHEFWQIMKIANLILEKLSRYTIVMQSTHLCSYTDILIYVYTCGRHIQYILVVQCKFQVRMSVRKFDTIVEVGSHLVKFTKEKSPVIWCLCKALPITVCGSLFVWSYRVHATCVVHTPWGNCRSLYCHLCQVLVEH